LSHDVIPGGTDLLVGINHQNASTIFYGYRCPFFNSHGCKWSCRVVVQKDGLSESAILCRDADARAQHHEQHPCVVEVDATHVHVPHNGPQKRGPHTMWVAVARRDPGKYSWTRAEIQKWFTDNAIQTAAGDLNNAISRCMRHNNRTGMASMQRSLGIHETSSERAKLRVMCNERLFKNVVQSPTFNVHEPYFIPGSLVRDLHDDTDDRPPLVLMITTLNLILNVARSNGMPGSAGAIAGVDHTHKVLLAHRAPAATFPPCNLSCLCRAVRVRARKLDNRVFGSDGR